MNFLTKHRNAYIRLAGLGFIVLFSMLNAGKAVAQSSTQVTIIGVPPVLSTPFTDDIRNNFENGQYQVILNYSGFSTVPVDFVFDFALSRNGRELVRITSAPIAFTPGSYIFSSFFQEIQFRETADDILNSLDSELTNQLIQTGAVPEGNYTVEITARPFTQQSGIIAIPGRAMFSVRYPTPPILVSIPDGANVTFDTPTFSWTPVVSSIGGTFEYDILLVEVYPEQTPLQALNSNRAHMQETLVAQTVLPYTLQYLPLEEGATYAWRVTARDAFGRIPLQNEGESDIYTFTYRDETDEPIITDLEELETITLVPGFAEVVDLERLEVSETGSYYELNGIAALTLDFEFTDPLTVRVSVNNLRIQTGSLDNPILMGGEVTGSLPDESVFFGNVSEYIGSNELAWRFGDGISLAAEIEYPLGGSSTTTGTLQVDRSGLTGEIYAEAPAGESLFSLGSSPAEIFADRILVQFPAQFISVEGTLVTPGIDGCRIPALEMTNENFRAYADCDYEGVIEIVPGSDLVTLEISSLTGEISGSWDNADQLNYNLSMNSSLNLSLDDDITEVNSCGFSGMLKLGNEEGLSAENFVSDCVLPNPYLDLGIFKLLYENLVIEQLAFEENEGWDFVFVLDGSLMLPAVQKVPLPEMENIRISRDGISFPAIEFDEADLQPFTVFELGEFEISMSRFAIDNQVFPWFEWDGTGSGPLDVELEAAIAFPDVCKSPLIGYLNASMQIDGITGDIEFPDAGSCQWAFGEGYAINMTQLDGAFSLKYIDRKITPEADLNVDGELVLGEPFICNAESNTVLLENFDMRADGNGFEASISNMIPGCSVAIGPYEASVTGSDLVLSYSGGAITFAELNAQAELNLGTEQNATGSFALNLITGEFSEMSFELEGPFEWGVPKNDPILLFTVNRATLNETGLFIDGRQTLTVDDESMGATFDELLIDWSTFEVLEGRIILDEQFSFEAGIDPNSGSLDYFATMRDSSLAYTPGVLLTLAGTVVVDSLGLHTTGTSGGELNFGDFSLDDIEVVFDEEFAMGLDPFEITRGSAELYWDQQRVALIDETGFNPDLAFFGDQFLPDRIPLPTEDIAYLELRRNGSLVVDAVNMGDGTYRIDTMQGEPLRMVIPALQGTSPQAPQVDVTLTDFRVNPSTGNFVSGEARALVDAAGLGTDLESIGIPLIPEEIIYTSQDTDQGSLTALFLRGNLSLLDHQFENAGTVTLFIQSDGNVKGNFSFTEISESISLEPGSSRITFSVDSFAGYLDIPLTMPGTPDLEVALSGDFQINGFDNQPVASASLEALFTEQGFSVTNFQTGALLEDASLDFEFFSFTVDQIETLSLTYSDQDGFEYFADLDVTIELLLPDFDPVEIPLKNIDLRTGAGIVIPQQDIHDGSIPALNAPEFDLGVFTLRPIAFRMDRDTLNIHQLNAASLIDLLPEMDLELTFPYYSTTAPELSQISLSLNGVSFDSGLLTGSVYPYSTGDNPITLPLGPVSLSIDLFEGDLFETDSGGQGFALDLSGTFSLPDSFTDPESQCSETQVQFSLSTEGYVSGRAEQFLPCGALALGPLSLSFGQSILELAVSNEVQSATIDGTATAEIEREGLSPVTATGQLEYDLISDSVLSGSIAITEPFTWYVPSEDSLFAFTVQNATIDQNGLVFNGSGNLDVGDGTVSSQFNNLALSLADGSITGGSVTVQNQFAFDVTFGPTTWAVSDPSDPIDYSSGIRLGMPSGITIDENGFTATGQTTASLRFAGESYDGLQLDLVDLTLGLQPVSVISGRADLILDDQGTPVRLAYYDSNGFHLDNLAGAIAMPDTLGLPSKDIAYIVLRDEQGQNLVQSADVDGGLEFFTTDPVPLVLAGLTDSQGNSPQVDVSFSNVVVNSVMEVISGSITADVSNTPLNLTNYGDFPIGLSAIHYKKEGSDPYQLYLDAVLNLPPSLTELEVVVRDIILGADGFGDMLFEAGLYTSDHTEGTTPPVASQSFSGDDLIMKVRGVELKFGNAPYYRLSGDMQSSFLTSEAGDSVNIHFSGEYQTGNWNFNLDVDHIVPQKFPIGVAELILDDLRTEIDQNDFNLVLDGRLSLSEIAGNDFEIGIEGLRIGTGGVSVDNVNSSALTPQQIGLFGQSDNLTINTLDLSLTSDRHLMLTAGGWIAFLERNFMFSDLRIGTDGTFQMGSGNVNLIDPSSPVQLMEEYLILTSLRVGVNNNQVELTAAGTASVPDPMQSTTGFTISVDHEGSAEVTGPSFTFSDATVNLGDLAKLELTGAGLQVNSIAQADLTFYASADIDIDGNLIQFGTPGSPNTWGIRYRMEQQKLEWNISNTPTFTFDAGFFNLSISNVYLTDSNASGFGVSLDANAKFKLEGIGGAGLQIENFTITESGIGSMGDVVGGGFSLASAVSVNVGQFSWGQDEDITVIRQSGSDDNPGSVEETIRVDEYLRFGSENGSAVSITVEGGFSGGIEEIFYYKNSQSFYLNIEGVNIQLSDHARIFASFEYEKQPDGFLLKVAGGGSFDTPGGQRYGLAAMGRMSTLGDEFSFGIFVAVQAEIPVFPGVISLTEVGGGFFYNATNEDFEDVADLSGYQFYGERPWIEKSGNYDFAIVVYAGVGLLGMGGGYALEGSAILLITDQWFAMDVKGSYLGFDQQLSGGMYLEVQWDPFVSISGGGGATIDFGFLLTGNLDITFFAIEDWQNSSGQDDKPMIWGVMANNNLDIFGGVASATAEFVISKEGFYVGIEVSGGFDVWVISVNTTWGGSIWWIYGEQFGAFVEIEFNATLFKVAEIGATLKGALIIDNGYLIYASASAYVSVLFVFEGRASVWVSMRNGRLRGGLGSNSEYESMIRESRDKARDMSRKIQETLAAMEELQNVPEILKIDEGVLAAAGEQLVGNRYTSFIFDGVINKEQAMAPVPPIHNSIRNFIQYGTQRRFGSDYNLSQLRSAMEQEINSLQSTVQQVEGRFEQVYDMALTWEDEAAILMDDVIQNPVQSAVTQADSASGATPGFSIDAAQASSNADNLSNLKSAIDELDAKFTAAIDSVSSYIGQIDRALSMQIRISGLPQVNPLTGQYEYSSGISVDAQPSANMISEQYSKTTEAIDHFYGNYVAHRWNNLYWATRKSSGFMQLTAGNTLQAVIDGNESMLRHLFPNMSMNFVYNGTGTASLGQSSLPSSSQVDRVTEAASSRVYAIHRLDPNTTISQAYGFKNDFESQMRSYAQSSSTMNSFLLNFVQKGVEFWYDTPRLGFESVSLNSKAQAEQMVADYKTKIRDMETAHENFTSLINDIYRSKASLTMTLHGMVDLYSAQKEAMAGDSAAAPLYQLKQDIEEQLRPPSINNISVSNSIEDYNNRITLDWTATHPSGIITENSYYLAPGTNANLMARGLLSTGSKTEVTRYLFKESMAEFSRDMRVVIRSRGPSGLAISKPAVFTASVDNSSSSGASGGTQSIDEVDTTAPSRPLVTFGYNKSTRRLLTRVDGAFVFVDFETYWTSEADQIVFTAISVDYESDIAAFEYAIGSTAGGSDIVNWTEVQGERVITGISSASNTTLDNVAQKITVRNLNVDSGEHYISVRAVNGEGLKSSIKEVSIPVKYDGENPSVPGSAQVTMPVLDNPTSVFMSAVTTTPYYQEPPAKERVSPSIRLTWSSSFDATSGIDEYEYFVSSQSTPEGAVAAGDALRTVSGTNVTLFRDPVSYSDSVFVHMRSVDYAGLKSDFTTFGPYIAPDPSRPLTPRIRARGKPSGIGFHVVRPSLDWENMIDKYEYTVSVGFGANLFNWRDVTLSSGNRFALALYTMAADRGSPVSGALATYVGIPADNLTEGERLMMKVRSVNRQGIVSGIGQSYAVVYDTSPPTNPSISTSRSGSTMYINVNNLNDPESGVLKVEYRVYDTARSTIINKEVVPWTDLVTPGTIRRYSFDASTSVNISGRTYTDLQVYVRITNANGMQTTVSYKPVLMISPTQTSTFNYNFNF